MNAAAVLIETTAGPVITLTLNRPEKRNALDVGLMDRLAAAIAAADRDPRLRILVLRGAGRVFCSGLDLSEAFNAAAVGASADRIENVFRALAGTRLITIAAVQGAAVAGGAGLMNACDFAVAMHDTKFAYPEVRRGIVPALIMTFLRRHVRERDARELLLLGKPCDASRALAIGLINRIADSEQAFETEIHSIIGSLLQGGPGALAATKRLIADLWPSSIDDDLARARAVHLIARNSGEAKEGVAAFNEKRPPHWAP